MIGNYRVSNYKLTFPASRDRKEFILYTLSKWRTHKSWKQLTDTAEITIAKAMYFDEVGKVFELIKTGDPMILEAGYDGSYVEEFRGYVSEILDDMPVVLKCEDAMYKLKRTPVHKSYGSINLQDLLPAIMPAEFSINAMNVELGSIVMRRTTVSQVLTYLKDHYGIYSYFDGNTLVSGKIYTDNGNSKNYKYTFFKDIIKNDLKYRRKDDIRLKVTMTSYLSNGTNKSITVGDQDGQEEKLICTNVTSDSALRELAQKCLDRLKVDGYHGTMTVFGGEPIKHGDSVTLENDEFPERSGIFYIDDIVSEGDDNAHYTRIYTLGPKAA